MKKYIIPVATILELHARSCYTDNYSLSEEEGDEQWGRKRSEDTGKSGVGSKLWEDIK